MSYASEQWIVKEAIIDPRFNNTDFRYTANATKEEDIGMQEIELLQEFANVPKAIAVMICNPNNIDFMKRKIDEFRWLKSILRYYNNIPMILNERAASLLPKLNERNEKLSAFSVLVITLNELHKRLVFMKDNKSYAQNVAGMTEDEDFPSDRQNLREDFALRNTACRELREEINLSVDSERKAF